MTKKKKQVPSYDKATIKVFWAAALENRGLFLVSLLAPLGAILMFAVAPMFIGRIIGSLVAGTDPNGYVLPFIVAAALGVLCNRIGFTVSLQHQAKTMALLEEKAFEAIMQRSVGFHNDNVGGKLVSDVIDYSDAYNKLSGAVLMQIGQFIVIMLVGTVYITVQSPFLGMFIAAMALLAIGGAIRDSRSRFGLRQGRLKIRKLTTAHIADTILNAQTVKTFANEDTEIKTHQKHGSQLLSMRIKDWSQAGIQGNNRIAMLWVLQIGFILAVVHVAQTDPAMIGVGIFGFAFATTVANRLFEASVVLRAIDDALLAASPMTEIIQKQPEVLDHKNAKVLHANGGQIDVSDMWFRYTDDTSKKNIFSKLNLSIPAGQKIGLVGPSGGGKSTLTRLLMRFDDIQAGEIAINGQNIADVTQKSLRNAISYVPQEPLLFHRSIFENIAYGQPDATLDQVKKAAKMANAHDFIRALPNGYDTTVGERGVKLSGGQRQRIAIARAMLKNSPILVLDEATSALDSESEKLVQEALWKLLQGKTAIVIAHRLSTIQKMDRIIVLDKGTIVEDGDHKELVKQDGLYAKLWSHQSGGFIEE